jgi:hypothetical protein
MSSLSADERRSLKPALVAFSVGVAFWPVFVLLTYLEEYRGAHWLTTSSPKIWLPVAVLAFVSITSAPLFTSASGAKKLIFCVLSACTFVLVYLIASAFGAHYLSWDD